MKRKSNPDEVKKSPVSSPTISWYPGHMYKAQKRLSETLKSADVILELRDARIPFLSGNDELDKIIGNRLKIIIFNKTSLSSPETTRLWKQYFSKGPHPFIFTDADSKDGLNRIFPLVAHLTEKMHEKYAKRKMRPPPIRLAIIGIPNVGKSTLINRLVNKKSRSTAPTPGHTRNMSWVQLEDKYLLMDSPGIMLPRLDSNEDAFKLGWVGSIKDTIIGEERLGFTLIDFLIQYAPEALSVGYQIENPIDAENVFNEIGKKRGFLKKGGGIDYPRTSEIILSEFRNGKLGPVSFETPP